MGGGGGGGMGQCGGNMGMGMNACFVYPGSPNTPGWRNPDVVFRRSVYMNGSMTMDDGVCVPIWGFLDTDAGGGGGMMGGGTPQFPSPAMRVTEGQIVHTQLNVSMMNGVHTIHHHGIEPEYHSDGVGHLSHDVSGTYTYQWRPAHAGTYFYHCHTNTVLHAEMGMYGALIVDPRPGRNDPPGTKRAFAGGPTYDVEAIWAVDEIDPRWHQLGWTAGTCGENVGLHNLDPRYFIITGVDGARSALTAPGVAVQMQRGQRLLVRYICAGYLQQRVNFGGLTASIVASDGRPLPNPVNKRSFKAVSAERYDCIIQPQSRGTYTVSFDILHWITGNVLGTARTRINVT
jgi:FtsP/CotA-like multicopper oxidase with cupredoxin domain